MAQADQLPCDGDSICMVCKTKPSDEDKLTCNTCVTPWHVSCLALRPETLASTLQWDCPDCTTLTSAAGAPASVCGGETGELIAAIRAIEADASLTEQQKAKRRQELLSGPDRESKETKGKERENKNDVLDIIDENVKCSFCIQLPERPVTTPCGHNFCLKCFLKWTGQGNSTCAKCRHSIPPKMASQPRINSTLVAAIRMARLSKSISTEGPLKVYHFVHNQFRPDKAYTTERAKKNGMANAASGRIFVTTPSDHFGPILAENDPERQQGVLVGECWELRMECRQWGIHYPPVSGIAGQSHYGAQSVVLSGGYEDDEDHGEWFLYTGSGGRDLSGNKRTNKTQSFDQTFKDNNEALRLSCKRGYPVRVVRSYKEKRSSYAPEKGLRYDGIYRIEKCWRKVGKQGFKVCRYLFVRCDNDPAPWTSDEHGDRPRPLPTISELKRASDLSERTESPSWDYDEEDDCWKWKRPPPPSRKRVNTGNPKISEDKQKTRGAIRKAEYMSVKEKLLKEFSCLLCKNVMTLPLTAPCAHNFCKPCLEGKFAGQAFTKERSRGGRTLRSQKNVMKCPACSYDISEFLQNPQVNREVMDVIEKLQHRPEGENTKEESTEEEIHACEKDLEALSGDEENDLSNPQAEVKSEGAYASEEYLEALSGDEENEVSNPQAEGKAEGARKRKEADSKPSNETKPKRKLKKNEAGDISSKTENAAKEKIVSEDMLDDDNKLEVPVVKSPAKKASTNKEKTNGVARRGRTRGGSKG